jgi:hypothetical protein
MGKGKRLQCLSREQQAKFPNMNPSNHRVTSDPTTDYNCIAYAAGDKTQKWDCPPLPKCGRYWPPGATRGPKLDALMSAFKAIGYTTCDNGNLEIGFEKVALYVDDNGEWQHAARQCKDGAWTSKLGYAEDIRHTTPGVVETPGNEDPGYGHVVQYMKRPRSPRGKRHGQKQTPRAARHAAK